MESGGVKDSEQGGEKVSQKWSGKDAENVPGEKGGRGDEVQEQLILGLWKIFPTKWAIEPCSSSYLICIQS